MKTLRSFFKTEQDVFLFCLLVWLDEEIMRGINGLPLLQAKPILMDALLLLIAIAFFSLFSYGVRIHLETWTLMFFTVYALAQTIHFLFFDTYFSLTKLTMLSELSGVHDEIGSKFRLSLLLFVVPPVLWYVWRHYRRQHPVDTTMPRFSRRLLSGLLACFIGIASSSALVVVRAKTTADMMASDSYSYQTMSNKTRVMNRFGMLAFLYRDLISVSDMLAADTIEDDAWIDSYIEEYGLSENAMTGTFAGKNLILILAESCGAQAIDPDLTPTLYQMSQEGYYWTNFYSPLYPSNTNDTEFIVNTSLVPSIEGGTTSKTYCYNQFPYSLASLLSEQGYACNSYHSFYKSFYNREQFHSALGFSYYYAAEDLGITLGEDETAFRNWPDDAELFDAVIDNTDTSQPFFDFVITASGHMPYSNRAELEENYEKVLEVKPGIDHESAMYYAAQMKLDEGIAELLSRLEEEGVLEDTVIVLYGDHWPYGLSTDASLYYFYGNNKYEFMKYRTPFLIYNAGTAGETSDALASTFDVYPTLANLFGLDTSGAWITGKDLFSGTTRPIPFSDHSVLSTDYYYDAATGKTIYFSDITEEEAAAELADMEMLYTKSQLLLSSDYYRNHYQN